jgi:DNA-binding response OmpR family regulator
MPNLDGISMIKELRGETPLAKSPITALTAYGKNMQAEAVDAGADTAVEKPFDFEMLIAKVNLLLS